MTHDLQERFPFIEVDACRECNNLLNTRDLWTIAARKKFIRRILRIRYRRLLKLPDWTDEQLKELGRNLRSYIKASIIAKQVLLERLRF